MKHRETFEAFRTVTTLLFDVHNHGRWAHSRPDQKCSACSKKMHTSNLRRSKNWYRERISGNLGLFNAYPSSLGVIQKLTCELNNHRFTVVANNAPDRCVHKHVYETYFLDQAESVQCVEQKNKQKPMKTCTCVCVCVFARLSFTGHSHCFSSIGIRDLRRHCCRFDKEWHRLRLPSTENKRKGRFH